MLELTGRAVGVEVTATLADLGDAALPLLGAGLRDPLVAGVTVKICVSKSSYRA